MPYNANTVAPRREPLGQVQLPLSRVKKIIALDNDVNMCSNNAAFVITLATELFIQYLAEQGHRVVKSERKPRRNIQYRDLSNAVAHQDNLEFLVDVVPRTVPFKQAREKKAPSTSKAVNGESSVGPGQTTLDGRTVLMNGATGAARSGAVDDVNDGSEDPNTQLELETRRVSATSASQAQNGWSGSRDVEMS